MTTKSIHHQHVLMVMLSRHDYHHPLTCWSFWARAASASMSLVPSLEPKGLDDLASTDMSRGATLIVRCCGGITVAEQVTSISNRACLSCYTTSIEVKQKCQGCTVTTIHALDYYAKQQAVLSSSPYLSLGRPPGQRKAPSSPTLTMTGCDDDDHHSSSTCCTITTRPLS